MTQLATPQDFSQLFAKADAPLEDQQFTETVMTRTDAIKKRLIIRRLVIGATVSLVMLPIKDLGLVFSQLMITSLVDINNIALAQFLAPINTVGGLMSAVLLGIRALHRRLLTY